MGSQNFIGRCIWRIVAAVVILCSLGPLPSTRTDGTKHSFGATADSTDYFPTVVSVPSCGLGNRMRNVNGAMMMAMSMDTKLEIKWVGEMPHCAASFSDIFGPVTSPNIKITEIPKSTAREKDFVKFGPHMTMHEIPNSLYCEGYCVKYKKNMVHGCKPCPWNRNAHVYENKSNIVVFGCSFCTYEGDSMNDQSLLHHGMCLEGLKIYRPPVSVLDEIKAKNISREHTAGVHIRTGDKLKMTTGKKFRSSASVDSEVCLVDPKNKSDIANYYVAGMHELMRMDSSIKRFVVASDNMEVVRLVSEKFSKGVVVHHRPENVMAACTSILALDLWSLAYTKVIIGSFTSTFGYLAAALGENKPTMYIDSCRGKLTTGRYANEMVNDGFGKDLLASNFHMRVFCSSTGDGCGAMGKHEYRRLSDIHAQYPQKYLSGGGVVEADVAKLLL